MGMEMKADIVVQESNTKCFTKTKSKMRFPVKAINGKISRFNNTNGYIKKPKRARSTAKHHQPLEKAPFTLHIWMILSTISFIIERILKEIKWTLLYFTFPKKGLEPISEGFVPILDKWALLVKRHYASVASKLVINSISSAPGINMSVNIHDRKHDGWEFPRSGATFTSLNLVSYNYLSFVEEKGICDEDVEATIRKYGCGIGSSQHEIGNLDIQHELDRFVAQFVGKEAAVTFAMGFATNTMNIPALVSGKGCLLISDELNHASLILGTRLSKATVRVFKHNDTADLEKQIRTAIIKGQPQTGRAWKKIIIIVEGVYSMEGTIVNLPEVIRIKKKYKAYLYLDEAHSIGALGPHGRGVVDYFGLDPADVDVMMGTFTKSFGGMGGYIAGDKKLINYIRQNSQICCYGNSMSSPVAQQVLSALKIIAGMDGTDEGRRRLARLAWNTRYTRRRLREMGFIIWGNNDSPVIPLFVFYPIRRLMKFYELCQERGLAVVAVGNPVVPFTLARVRLCMSAGHTKDSLDKILSILGEVGSKLNIRCSKFTSPDFSENDEDFRERYPGMDQLLQGDLRTT